MKTGQNFWILYSLLAICQIALCNYAHLGPYLMLTMLPAMVMCIPLSVGTPLCMMIAFMSGLAVDWLSEGLIGINASSLLPVAFCRTTFIRIFLGEDIINRKDSFSIRKNGAGKIAIVLSAALMVFLAVYILLDGAGTRPFWFCAARFCSSLAVNLILSLVVAWILTPDDRK
jgi:hypothetical protein